MDEEMDDSDYGPHNEDDIEFIELTTREAECLLFRLGDFPWLIKELMDTHYAPDICHHAMTLCDMAESSLVPVENCSLSKDILSRCVEKNDWLDAPKMFPDLPAPNMNMMKKTLRSLAEKLDNIGVDINYLPTDT